MHALKWWQKAVFYQVYPRSFSDSQGDGIGDLPGIVHRLDYLKDLGVDAIWLSPIFPSPLWDCGYDVADYAGIAPEYGSLEDFKRLLEGVHNRDMHLILDLVLNHTSNAHPWFLESASSLNNPHRNWYIWREGRNGGPPNNWYSFFGGPAWEYDPHTRQYYYHFFFKQQPDLNWRNPEVRQAMFNIMRFWLEVGVDGFRLDAIGTLFEDESLADQDSPVDQVELYRLTRTAHTAAEWASLSQMSQKMYHHQRDLPEIHEFLRETRRVVDEFQDRVLVGETDQIEYLGTGEDELHMIFNFPLMHTDRLTPAWIRLNQQQRLSSLPMKAWPCNTLGNHDAPRILSHFGDGIHDQALAKEALALMLTLRGTPFLYYGEEIGMVDHKLEDLTQFRDQWGVVAYHLEIEHMGSSPEAALAFAGRTGRDKCRTPMQWEDAPNGGFSPAGVNPWLPVNPNYHEGVNVGEQDQDPDSLLSFYRNLLRVRKATSALISGSYIPLQTNSVEYLAFLRQDISLNQTCLVIINFSERSLQIDFSALANETRLVFSNRVRKEGFEGLRALWIDPFEVYIGMLSEGTSPASTG